ncbi:sensor histidine kinase [Xanthobacter sp. TB0136]|uniref:sensor histidine kinase n=1 Tax=Xanthobacter sp. TB0136 TaxID=3459177 RepID=UPI004039D4EE
MGIRPSRAFIGRLPRPATLLRAGALLLGLAAVLLAVVKAGEIAQASVAERLASDARHRSQIYAQSLEVAIERFGYMPAAAALDPNVRRLLRHPRDAALVATVNDYLQTLNRAAGAAVVYVIATDGLTIASSNWDTPQTYVGENFAYRPYFTEALAGRQGRFYAIGSFTGVPGYFISAPVVEDGHVLGVVVTKVSLDRLEAVWQEAADKVLVADRHGIIFLSSDPDLKFRTTRPVDAQAMAEMERTRQYGVQHYPLLNLGQVVMMGGVPLSSGSDLAPHGRVIAGGKELPDYGWSLLLFADAATAELAGRSARLGMVLACCMLALGGLYWRQRLRRARESRMARTVLEAAHRELEAKVEARTAALSAANAKLAEEIDERRRAVTDLRAAQEELMQAAKMATLGQMAAGITHELNQPLTAMRGLAENTVKLLQAGREEAVEANLVRITALVDRLGKITGQLRGFSRRATSEKTPVDLPATLSESLAILAPRIRATGTAVVTDLDPAARLAVFEPIRLSQVLVNLVGNALDAVKGRPDPWVRVRSRRHGARILVSVEDNGPGLPPETLAHIFDPFFTTKPPGEGLGLGLPISLAIAREFGASLAVRPRAEGGLTFDLVLETAEDDAERTCDVASSV